jgi:dipeptidyl aminopeptidase/acylaminoacyl peptidase
MKKLFIAFLAVAALPVQAQNKLTPEFLFKLGRISEARLSADGKTVIYNVRTFDVAANKGNSDIYSMDASGAGVLRIAGGPENETAAKWRPDGRRIGYLSDKDGSSQLWEMNLDGSNKIKITSVEGGISNFGYAPKGTAIWYTSDVKVDKKPSEIFPDLPKTENARIIDNLNYRHWDAWSDYTYSHLFIVAYSDGKITGAPVDIMKGERFDTPLKPMGGEEQIAFSPDDGKIAYTCKKLFGTDYAISTNSDIYVYDLATKQNENVSNGMAGYDINPSYSPDGKYMLWLSMETAGYEADRNRIFIYNIATRDKKELLTGFDYSVEKAEFDSKSSMVYFIAGINATEQVFSFDMNPKSKKPLRQITSMNADITDFSVSSTASPAVMISTVMAINQPVEIFSIDLNTGATKQVSTVNSALLGTVKMGNVEKRMIKTTDGKDMLTWVIYPPDFDRSKKYPTLLYCQGGPQSTVSQFFSYRWNFELMAANGYIVVAPNRRGLPSFGEKWNDDIRGDWGGQAMNDLLSAIDEVSKEPFVDRDKLGAVGASFGGYSVYWLAGHHNKRFKAFIAHDGVFNLESMYGGTEEIWFPAYDLEGPYWQEPKPKSYEKFSPHNFVQNWDTPILIISNEKDFRVPVGQGMEAFTAAQLMKVPSRFLYFPDEGHWVLKPQNSILWQRVFFDWLDRYLK